MSWYEILKETKLILKAAETILALDLPENGDIRYDYELTEKPPSITISFYVVSDDSRRSYIIDAHGERVASIFDQELMKIGEVMGKIKDLKNVKYCQKQWTTTGLLSYKIGVDYAQFLGGKKDGKNRDL